MIIFGPEMVVAIAHKREHPIAPSAPGRERRARIQAASRELFTHAQWQAVVDSYGGRCAYCDTGFYEHREHVIPLSSGGLHVLGNLVPSCASCNFKKRTKTWTPRPPASIIHANTPNAHDDARVTRSRRDLPARVVAGRHGAANRLQPPSHDLPTNAQTLPKGAK